MSPQATRAGDEPTLASVLHHMLERDARNVETTQLVLQRLGDQSVALQGLQSEVALLRAIGERQAALGERQIELAERSAAQTRLFEAAQAEAKDQSRKLDEVRMAISKQQGGVHTLNWVVGVAVAMFLGLGVPLAGFVYTSLQREVTRLEAKHDKDMEAVQSRPARAP